MEIRYKKLTPEAKTPFKVINIDAGFDLYAIWKKETDKYFEYGTGLAFEIPEGYVGLIFPRSSITKYDLMLKNSVGVIDASYRGEIMFRFIKAHNDLIVESKDSQSIDTEDWVNANHIAFRKPDYYDVEDRVGQIIFIEIPKISLIESDELSDTERGSGGYGHTGK